MADYNIQQKDKNSNNLYPITKAQNIVDLVTTQELTLTNSELYVTSDTCKVTNILGVLGRVHGIVKFPTTLTNPVIATLPSDSRPVRTERFNCLAKLHTPSPADTFESVYVTITTDGKVTVNYNTGKIDFLTLDNITYPMK